MLRFTAVDDGDIPQLRELANVIWHAHYPGMISREQIDYMLERLFAPETLRRELAAGAFWELAWIGEQAVGFLCCLSEVEARRVKLSKLYLLPAFHGRGLGREMLQHVKEHAASLKAREIYLTVNKRNATAIRAYQKAGFRIDAEKVADIGGGYVMDDCVMMFEMARGAR